MNKNLIIGLGGTGGHSIAAIKCALMKHTNLQNALNDANIQLEYLYIDSSPEFRVGVPNQFADDVSWTLTEEEFVGIAYHENMIGQAQNYPWLGNIGNRLPRVGAILGAGQMRRLGRLLFWHHHQDIEAGIIAKRDALNLQNQAMHVHIFATLGGGTGSGGIIDLITLIKTLAPRSIIHLNGYVAGDVYAADDAKCFFENEYTVLRDINALMAGRFRPHMPNNANYDRFMHNQEVLRPIDSVCICSEVNNIDNTGGIKGQIGYMASATLSLISNFAQAPAHLRHSITGENYVDQNSGEPAGDIQRSYRFRTISVKTWSIPVDIIQKYLKLSLVQLTYRGLIKGNPHHSNSGTRANNLLDITKEYEATALHQRFENYRSENEQKINRYENASPKTGKKIDFADLTKDIIAVLSGLDHEITRVRRLLAKDRDQNDDIIKLSNAAAEILIDALTKAYEYQRSRPMMHDGAHQRLLEAYALDRNTYMETVRNESQDTWGMEDIIANISSLKEQLRHIAMPQEGNLGVGNLEKRRDEWAKMGILSYQTAKPQRMLEAHFAEAKQLLNQRFERLLQLYRQHYSSKIIKKLVPLLTKAENAKTHFETEYTRAEKKRKKYYNSIVAEQAPHHIYDVDRNNFKKFEEQLKDYIEKLDAPCLALLPNVTIQELQDFTYYTSANEVDTDRYHAQVSDHCAKHTNQLDMNVSKRTKIQSIRVSNILERIRSHDQKKKESLVKELSSDKVGCATISRLNVDAPNRPVRQAIAVGFPDTQTQEELSDLFRKQLGDIANMVYTHSDTSEIRFITSNYCFPARYMDIVRWVIRRYRETLTSYERGANQAAEDKLFLSNIEGDGLTIGSEMQPSLLMPEEWEQNVAHEIRLGTELYVAQIADAIGENRIPVAIDKGYAPNNKDRTISVFAQHDSNGQGHRDDRGLYINWGLSQRRDYDIDIDAPSMAAMLDLRAKNTVAISHMTQEEKAAHLAMLVNKRQEYAENTNEYKNEISYYQYVSSRLLG